MRDLWPCCPLTLYLNIGTVFSIPNIHEVEKRPPVAEFSSKLSHLVDVSELSVFLERVTEASHIREGLHNNIYLVG